MSARASLPDVSRFEALGETTFRELGRRLDAIEFEVENTLPIMDICSNLLDPLRLPLRRYHLRQRNDPLAHAIRLFMLGDTLRADEARAALGDGLLERALATGLAVASADRIACPFFLSIVNTVRVLSDNLTLGGDAVMGAGDTTADLCRAVAGRRARRVLDVGCGAGTLALFLAKTAEHVVATDVNPRALILARANDWLNGGKGLDLRLGDMFAPVAGERFDLIVAQPPFIARPEGAPDTTYLYGGERGDELATRALRELPARLASGGRAVLLVEWPRIEGDEALEARIGAALGDDSLSVLVLSTPEVNLDEWCAQTAVLEEQSLGESFQRRAVALRSHFDRLAVRSLELTLVVVLRNASGRPFRRRQQLLPFGRARVHAEQIDALIASAALSVASDAELLDARVRVPEGAELVERSTGFEIRFRHLLAPVELSKGAALLAAAADRPSSVRDVVGRLVEQLGGSAELGARALDGVRHALEMGVLEAATEA